ncbi:AMP-binding protein [Thalassobacillus pellis]|uniref:AMP-binding protein n=1 Tax=Thalassobacillus pellis TaxID=748008 RepID=UPI00196224BD|nr:AMP-binding protein [Thalassobacillus pellis]MBM7551487.1 long-chain acyl-CoA synthetase [Thalassobacillus pellis]
MGIIGEQIHELAAFTPDRIAIQADNQQLTYKQLQQQITACQRRIANLFPKYKGLKVGILLENNPDWLKLFIAVSDMGAIAIPFDPKWTEPQLFDIWKDAEPDLVVYSEKYINRFPFLQTAKSISFLELIALEDQLKGFEKTAADKEDIFYIGYTSGTTGKPKGYMRTHASWADCFSEGASIFSLCDKDHLLVPGPLVHSHFLYAAVQALHIGATLHLCDSFEPEKVWCQLEQEPITVLYIVPTMFEALKRIKQEDELKSLHTIISSGASWHKRSKQEAARMFPNASIFEFYGASELSFVSVQRAADSHIPEGVIGESFPKVEISIRNKQGYEADINEVGTIYVKSPWTFAGYKNLPEKDSEVFDGEWATVGDLAYRSSEGQMVLIGRNKNMIISGGLNIYPEEVEQVINRHSEIEEVIVLGLPDTYWGEQVTAVYKQRSPVSVRVLEQLCKKYLPRYKCPKKWIYVDDFFYTASGKVARKQMKEWVEAMKIQGKVR